MTEGRGDTHIQTKSSKGDLGEPLEACEQQEQRDLTYTVKNVSVFLGATGRLDAEHAKFDS